MEESTLESIEVIRAESLSDAERIKHGFNKEDFIEIRVERVNSVNIKLAKLDSTPGHKFSTLLRETRF